MTKIPSSTPGTKERSLGEVVEAKLVDAVLRLVEKGITGLTRHAVEGALNLVVAEAKKEGTTPIQYVMSLPVDPYVNTTVGDAASLSLRAAPLEVNPYVSESLRDEKDY